MSVQSKNTMTYLDYAATTPVDEEVLRAMLPFFTEIFGNPSSKHPCGNEADKAVKRARAIMGVLLNCKPQEIVFTGGASEANNLAIKGVAECYDEPKHFITSSFEHKATLQAMEKVESWGHSVTYIDPQPDGIINPSDIEGAITPDTVLCSIMHVNNEIGTIQPIDDIADICRANDVLFHTDATQSFGRMPIDITNIDFMSLSAHKIYGPKGIGALYVSDGTQLVCQIDGGSQEAGRRAGTQNVPGIVGLAEAAKKSFSEMRENWERQKNLEMVFLKELLDATPMSYIQGNQEFKVPWITNICFYEASGERVRDELSKRGYCVSRTSACAKSNASSHVLEAIKTRKELLDDAIRFSFGRATTEGDVIGAAKETARVVAGVRGGVLHGY
jgi:cysteine desulfurase